VLAIATLAVIPNAASSSDVVLERGSCNISGKETDLGASYVTSVKARNTSCGKALKLVKAYHGCRKDNGGANGHCDKVDGYKCDEKRESAPAQYYAKAKCEKGGKKVIQTYQQNT